jgi:LacI family transcriptional regulator
MEDVAARAGVSVTTVSHVLTNAPGKRIRPETREKVRAAAVDLGYVVTARSPSPRARRSHVIALIGDQIASTPFVVGMLHGAQVAAMKHGWILVIVDSGPTGTAEAPAIEELIRRNVDGFLYAKMYHQRVSLPDQLRGIPTVLVDATSADPSIPSVVPDEFGGGLAATRELIRHGHSRIAFINNVDNIPASLGRLAGYRSALEEAGIAFDTDLIQREAPESDGGMRAGRALLARSQRPSAIFAFNDRVAMGAYYAAFEKGLRIPDDLSIIGFDNQENIANGLQPHLTTVALPHFEMGAWAVQTLVRLIEDPDSADAAQVLLACPLVTRASIGAGIPSATAAGAS